MDVPVRPVKPSVILVITFHPPDRRTVTLTVFRHTVNSLRELGIIFVIIIILLVGGRGGTDHVNFPLPFLCWRDG